MHWQAPVYFIVSLEQVEVGVSVSEDWDPVFPVALLTQQWHFVLQQFVVAGREDSHGVAGDKASFLHQPLACLH